MFKFISFLIILMTVLHSNCTMLTDDLKTPSNNNNNKDEPTAEAELSITQDAIPGIALDLAIPGITMAIPANAFENKHSVTLSLLSEDQFVANMTSAEINLAYENGAEIMKAVEITLGVEGEEVTLKDTLQITFDISDLDLKAIPASAIPGAIPASAIPASFFKEFLKYAEASNLQLKSMCAFLLPGRKRMAEPISIDPKSTADKDVLIIEISGDTINNQKLPGGTIIEVALFAIPEGAIVSVDEKGIEELGEVVETIEEGIQDEGNNSGNDSNSGSEVNIGNSEFDYKYGWAKTFGGNSEDESIAVTTDIYGNIFVTGRYKDVVDFDYTENSSSYTSNGYMDFYITKIAPDGSYEWTKTFGGSAGDYGNAVTTDSIGNIYVTGAFTSTVDFDFTEGTDIHTSPYAQNIFVTKIEKNGSYGWTKTFGRGYGMSIISDSNNNIYVTGFFSETVDFDFSSGTDIRTSDGSADIFVTKIDSTGTYIWTKTFGGSSGDISRSITRDGSNNLYITGHFLETVDFDFSTGVDNQISNGSYDIFITKINSDSSYGWTKTFGGTSDDYAYSIATDSLNNVFITGDFYGKVDFDYTNNIDEHSSNGNNDIYMTKLNSDGSYGWTKTFGGISIDSGYSIIIDSLNNIIVTGNFMETVNFNYETATDTHFSNGNIDIFVTKINTNGSYGWTKTFGGTNYDYASSMATDKSDNLILTGYFYATADFDFTDGIDNHTSNGSDDIFITKIEAVKK